jgi:hypothetical protein
VPRLSISHLVKLFFFLYQGVHCLTLILTFYKLLDQPANQQLQQDVLPNSSSSEGRGVAQVRQYHQHVALDDIVLTLFII